MPNNSSEVKQLLERVDRNREKVCKLFDEVEQRLKEAPEKEVQIAPSYGKLGELLRKRHG